MYTLMRKSTIDENERRKHRTKKIDDDDDAFPQHPTTLSKRCMRVFLLLLAAKNAVVVCGRVVHERGVSMIQR